MTCSLQFLPRLITVAASTGLLLPFLGGVANAILNAEAISIFDVDHLVWKDYSGLPGVTFTVIAGNPSQPGF